ncbi:FecR family protein [Radicibacter daui]|uniref:FecR family protein n=1 Tax=Radicibacter daui TaxID=3064829 RepID=UPI004046CFD4
MQRDLEPTAEQKDEAALWHVRRAGGSLSRAQEEQLGAWLAASNGNRVAFDQMRVLWGQLEEPARRLAGQRPSSRLRRWLGGFSFRRLGLAGATAAVLAAGLWFADKDLIVNLQADIVAGRQAVTDMRLPDGSLVRLAANSALDTDFADGHRIVSLLRGQAFFEVVHREGDPFYVRSGDTQVRVVGTRFNVEHLDDGTVVTVQQGAVRVSPDAGDEGVLLGPGQQAAVKAHQLSVTGRPDLVGALSWLDGRLSVENDTVASLLARLENYQSGHILAFGDLAGKRISGSFPVDDVDGSLETVAAAVRARVVHLTPWLTVLY